MLPVEARLRHLNNAEKISRFVVQIDVLYVVIEKFFSSGVSVLN